jgi:hypothetical protein
MPSEKRQANLYRALKAQRHIFSSDEVSKYFKAVDKERIDQLSARISDYIEAYLPKSFGDRKTLQDYRINPYVLMTSASVMDLDDVKLFANFLFNTKFYMGLETSFGKSIEAAFVEQYPVVGEAKWAAPVEKEREFKSLEDLSREDRAVRRTRSIWREVDKSVVVDNRRFLISIKSGPNTINDTQVQAMTDAIISHHKDWALATHATYPGTLYLDIVIGLTYGTYRTTNNKENQILVKLLNNGFIEEDREHAPGVLIDETTRTIRVYRVIGKDFWAFLGNPSSPDTSQHIFLEVLLALTKALKISKERMGIEERINLKVQNLAQALFSLQISKGSLPFWVEDYFSEDELFWLITAVSSFYDEGV